MDIVYVFKEAYLPVFINNVKTRDYILSKIKNTDSYVFGKEIIRVEPFFDEYKEIKKELKTIEIKILISNKVMRACGNNITAFTYLVNDCWESAMNEATLKLLDLLYNEIRKDCEISCDNDKLKQILMRFDSEDFENILLHQLCEWQFLSNEDGDISRVDESFTTYTLVKYCNFTLPKHLRDKIKMEAEYATN